MGLGTGARGGWACKRGGRCGARRAKVHVRHERREAFSPSSFWKARRAIVRARLVQVGVHVRRDHVPGPEDVGWRVLHDSRAVRQCARDVLPLGGGHRLRRRRHGRIRRRRWRLRARALLGERREPCGRRCNLGRVRQLVELDHRLHCHAGAPTPCRGRWRRPVLRRRRPHADGVGRSCNRKAGCYDWATALEISTVIPRIHKLSIQL